MFGINPTPFDVRLVAFRIPIRIHPSFWLAAIFFCGNTDHPVITPPQYIFLWVICFFVSILVHELGHAFTAEFFGWPSDIVLYFGGGLAFSHRYHNNTPARSMAVSIMGPVAGFLLLAFTIGLERILDSNRLLVNVYRDLVFDFLKFMNLYYGLLNLIPVIPLDGGRILESFCEMLGFRRPLAITLRIGAVASGLAAYYFFSKADQPFAGALMLMLCVQNVSAMKSLR